MTFPVDVADLFASMDDLEEVKRALIREAAIRQTMAETGEDRQTIADMIDAMESMEQEAVLDLTEGKPTTLKDGLHRYVEQLEARVGEGCTLGSEAEDVTAGIVDELSALLAYPWPGDLAPADAEASWRSRLAQEVYQHADRIEREPETRSLGVALASVVRHVGDQIGKIPVDTLQSSR